MKNELRKKYKLKRGLLTDAEVKEKSICASNIFLESKIYKNAKNIMLYAPLGNETDTTHIMNRAFDEDKVVILPVTDEKNCEITPCYVKNGEKLLKGAFSIDEPMEKRVADISKIDVILVPGIVFDKNGRRVGFGKGCYDRFLKNTSALKIGFCYDFQICDKIPAEEHDITVDFLITEKEIIKTLYDIK